MSVQAAHEIGPQGHAVQFYQRDFALADLVGGYLADALRSEGIAVIAATSAHMLAFEDVIAASGIDVAQAHENGALVTLDATAVSSRLMADGTFNAETFDVLVGEVVRRAADRRRPIHIYGEIVALLWDAGHVVAAIELERLWNELSRRVPFSLLCAYPAQSMAGDDSAQALSNVCEAHSAVMGLSEDETSADGWPWRQREHRFGYSRLAARDARRFIGETLDLWNCQDLMEDAMFVASELVANSVVHARSDATVTVSRSVRGIRISVRDQSPTPPRTASMHGLSFVARIASRWGHAPSDEGKAVWAELMQKADPIDTSHPRAAASSMEEPSL